MKVHGHYYAWGKGEGGNNEKTLALHERGGEEGKKGTMKRLWLYMREGEGGRREQ